MRCARQTPGGEQARGANAGRRASARQTQNGARRAATRTSEYEQYALGVSVDAGSGSNAEQKAVLIFDPSKEQTAIKEKKKAEPMRPAMALNECSQLVTATLPPLSACMSTQATKLHMAAKMRRPYVASMSRLKPVTLRPHHQLGPTPDGWPLIMSSAPRTQPGNVACVAMRFT